MLPVIPEMVRCGGEHVLKTKEKLLRAAVNVFSGKGFMPASSNPA